MGTETDFGTTTEIIDPKTTTTTPHLNTTTEVSLNTTTSESSQSSTTPNTTTNTTTSTTTTSSSFDVVCPDSADGLTVFVPLPTDCSKFFACHGSRPILMECPPGLVFDPALNVCNYPQFVDCTSS